MANYKEPAFPKFTNGQVLQAKALNELREFVIAQTDPLVWALFEHGVFNGLNVSRGNRPHTLELTHGLAVSAQGQIISVNDQVIFHDTLVKSSGSSITLDLQKESPQDKGDWFLTLELDRANVKNKTTNPDGEFPIVSLLRIQDVKDTQLVLANIDISVEAKKMPTSSPNAHAPKPSKIEYVTKISWIDAEPIRARLRSDHFKNLDASTIEKGQFDPRQIPKLSLDHIPEMARLQDATRADLQKLDKKIGDVAGLDARIRELETGMASLQNSSDAMELSLKTAIEKMQGIDTIKTDITELKKTTGDITVISATVTGMTETVIDTKKIVQNNIKHLKQNDDKLNALVDLPTRIQTMTAQLQDLVSSTEDIYALKSTVNAMQKAIRDLKHIKSKKPNSEPKPRPKIDESKVDPNDDWSLADFKKYFDDPKIGMLYAYISCRYTIGQCLEEFGYSDDDYMILLHAQRHYDATHPTY